MKDSKNSSEIFLWAQVCLLFFQLMKKILSEIYSPEVITLFSSSVVVYIFAIQHWTANKTQNKEWSLKILLKNPLALLKKTLI